MTKQFARSLTIIVLALVVGSTSAQQLIPLPGSRADIELLTNTSFDTDSDGNKLPDGWSGKNTDAFKTDKVKCDKPDKLVAHTGTCAFMFRGNSDATLSKIQQKISDTSAIVNGASVTFSVFLDARSGVPGTTIGKAKIKYSDDTSTKFALAIPLASSRGVEDYQQLSDTQTVSIGEGLSIAKIKVDFRYQGTSGKFLIDDASFAVVTATDETPTPDDTQQPTTTATNETATPGEPTFTPTNTFTPTSTPTDAPTTTPLPDPFQLIASDGAVGDEFGYSVAISGDTVVVGANGANSDQGSAYVFVRSGDTWTEQQKLTLSDSAADDQFGYSVEISGDTIVVGVPGDDIGAINNQGSAYVFTRSGTTWTEQQKLTASDGAANDLFGYSVEISGETIVVGASYDDIGANSDQGSAYVFTRSGVTWTEQQKLTASDGAASDRFGYWVAISGDTVVVGASYDDIGAINNQGSAYVFTRSGTTWTQQQKLTASDGAANDNFGLRVAISGETIVVGAVGDTIGANSFQGSAYVFVRSGTTWTEQQKLTASDGAAFDFFGFCVAISGDTVVVGARGANSDQGSAYVFTRSGVTWTEQQQLTASDSVLSDDFGFAAAISGDFVVVGAHLDDIGANANQGSAWVFVLP